MHPLNLALRFCLEIIALVGWGTLGYQQIGGLWGIVSSVLMVCLAMTLWGVFAVPGDPSRSGSAPVPVSGYVRILVEAVVFGVGMFGLTLGFEGWFVVAALVLLCLHYTWGFRRLVWLCNPNR